MDPHSSFKGEQILESIQRSRFAPGGPERSERLVHLIRELDRAFDQGLSLDEAEGATRILITIIEDTFQPPKAFTAEGQDTDTSTISLTLDVLCSDVWQQRIALLPPYEQIKAYQIKDVLQARELNAHHAEKAIENVISRLRNSPVPMPRTAWTLVLRFIEMGIWPVQNILEFIDYVSESATDPVLIASARACNARLDVQTARLGQTLSRNDIDVIETLTKIDDEITEVFGKLYPISTNSDIDNSVIAELTDRIVAVSAAANAPKVASFLKYLLARLDAASGNLRSAHQTFRSLMKEGFAPMQTARYAAETALARRYPDDVLEVLSAAETGIPILAKSDVVESAFFELWRTAGPDNTALGLTEIPAIDVAKANANSAVIEKNAKSRLQAIHEKAIADWWHHRRIHILKTLGKVLGPEDFDDAVRGTDTGRSLKLPPESASVAAIEEIPGLTLLGREALISATRHPVSANLLAQAALDIIDFLEKSGFSHSELIRLLPGLAASTGHGEKRLTELLAQGRMDSAEDLLDGWEDVPDIPDDVLAELFLFAHGPLFTAGRWRSTVNRGLRLWKRLRGEPGRRCIDAVRDMALLKLEDTQERGIWVELVTLILESMPDDEARQRLFEWFKARVEDGEKSYAFLRLGSHMARRIGPAHSSRVRELHRRALAGADIVLTNDIAPDRARMLIERFLEIGGSDPVIEEDIADWFEWWTYKGNSALEAKIDVGEWLLDRLSEPMRRRVQERLRESLLTMLSNASSAEVIAETTQRLKSIWPDDPNVEILASAGAQTAPQWVWPLSIIVVFGSLFGVMLLMWAKT